MNKPTPASQFQSSVKEEALGVLSRLGVPSGATGAKGLPARSPITGEIVTQVRETSPEEAKDKIRRAGEAFPKGSLVDDLVGPQQKRRRNGYPQCASSSHVEHSLEFGWPFDRQFTRIGATQDFASKDAGQLMQAE